jgi:hypothetical protein
MKSAVADIGFGGVLGSAHSEASRAVDRNRSSGIPAVFRVRADRFDDKVEFVGSVDFASYAVGHVGRDELGFGEVIEPVDPLGIAVRWQRG